MTGEIKMKFNEVGVDVAIELSDVAGLSDKCFIIDALCSGLQLKGIEKSMVLFGVMSASESGNEEVENEG